MGFNWSGELPVSVKRWVLKPFFKFLFRYLVYQTGFRYRESFKLCIS